MSLIHLVVINWIEEIKFGSCRMLDLHHGSMKVHLDVHIIIVIQQLYLLGLIYTSLSIVVHIFWLVKFALVCSVSVIAFIIDCGDNLLPEQLFPSCFGQVEKDMLWIMSNWKCIVVISRFVEVYSSRLIWIWLCMKRSVKGSVVVRAPVIGLKGWFVFWNKNFIFEWYEKGFENTTGCGSNGTNNWFENIIYVSSTSSINKCHAPGPRGWHHHYFDWGLALSNSMVMMLTWVWDSNRPSECRIPLGYYYYWQAEKENCAFSFFCKKSTTTA